MYESEKNIFRTLNIALDGLLVLISFAITGLLRKILIAHGVTYIKTIGSPIIIERIILASLILYPLLLLTNRFYPTIKIRRFRIKLLIILKCITQMALIIIIGSFFINIRFNRTYIIFSYPILLLLATIKEWIVNSVVVHTQKKGNLKSTFLIGEKSRVDHILKRLEHDDLSLVITKKVETSDTKASSTIDINHVIDTLDKEPIELVIIAGFHGNEEKIREILVICEERGIEVWLESPFLIRRNAKTSFGYLADTPMVVFSTVPGYNWRMFAKTLFDYTFAILALPFFCIFYLIAGIGIKLSSPGPIFFIQKRGGLYGKPFHFYKFRTMIKDAEQRKDELQKFNIMKGPVFKIENDPRVFTFGRFLRRHSLDELPQVINIVKGEMSAIGPRPLPLSEIRKIKGADRRRLSMKPGLSCLWQISGRNEIRDFSEWVKLDLEYIDNWSFFLDIKIFLKTALIVLFKQKGAY